MLRGRSENEEGRHRFVLTLQHSPPPLTFDPRLPLKDSCEEILLIRRVWFINARTPAPLLFMVATWYRSEVSSPSAGTPCTGPRVKARATRLRRHRTAGSQRR